MDQRIEQALDSFVAAARLALQDELLAVVLFGSAAEDRLRATSDVNVVVVLDELDEQALPGLAGAVRAARASIGLAPMFLRRAEIPLIAQAFPVKMADIRRRRRVLFGEDPFEDIVLSRADEIRRVQQILMNWILRTRERLVELHGRDDQLGHVLAESAGPLRAASATILELEGNPAATGREASQLLAREHASTEATDALRVLGETRESPHRPAGESAKALQRLLAFATALHRRTMDLDGPWP